MTTDGPGVGWTRRVTPQGWMRRVWERLLLVPDVLLNPTVMIVWAVDDDRQLDVYGSCSAGEVETFVADVHTAIDNVYRSTGGNR